ncbi:MAG: iron-containing alcohol dehydrogenase [Nitrospirae bacterium]|nr:iron-containing alcohol dehydrogenase [Nitrospirota bacterium]MBF0535560.1 iron-containing alcohol dehydrogenase [Nitrospirota bacterium]MBF0617413.1 iron-containing alcohol dehydrogenase [Nitrospirota bacterium]
MINPFTFAKTPYVYFGDGKFQTLGKIVANTAKTIILLTGGKSLVNSGKFEALSDDLQKHAVTFYHETITAEPTPELIDKIADKYRNNNIGAVLAIGGGSVIDAGKAVSAMLPVNGSVFDYLEGVGKGLNHSGKKLPFIAVSTTAGTGSEATKNAVLSRVGVNGFKRSLRHDNFVPDVAVIDPRLHLSCPSGVTSACAMDAFTQLLESFLSTKASPVTDALSMDAIRLCRKNIVLCATTHADDLNVRASMAYAAFISGVTLANAGLGVVHGFASSIGSYFEIPHGVVCGTLVGACTRKNIARLKEAAKDMPSANAALHKYAQAGASLTDSPYDDINANLNSLTGKIDEWTELLKIPKLSAYGIKSADFEKIASETGIKENPVSLSKNDLIEILTERL